MNTVLDIAWRLAVVAAAVAASVAIVSHDYHGAPTAILVGAILVAAGAIANRGWAVASPVAAAVVYCLVIFAMEGTTFDDERGETMWALVLVVLGGAAFLASIGLLLGLVLRMRAQSLFSPKNDAKG